MSTRVSVIDGCSDTDDSDGSVGGGATGGDQRETPAAVTAVINVALAELAARENGTAEVTDS